MYVGKSLILLLIAKVGNKSVNSNSFLSPFPVTMTQQFKTWQDICEYLLNYTDWVDLGVWACFLIKLKIKIREVMISIDEDLWKKEKWLF